MTDPSSAPLHRTRPHRPLLARWLPWLLSVALFTACGGGDGDGIGVGGTGSFASGPITGYGSIIVGGIAFDDSGARLLDDDGAPVTGGGNALRLGMTVDVTGRPTTPSTLPGGGRRAVGIEVRQSTAVLGPVERIDAAAGTLVALGQTVQVTGATLFGPSLRGRLAALGVGDVIAVHGLPDPAGQRIVATRIEAAPAARVWRLRGPVEAFPAARTLRIGQALLDVSGLNALPANLAVGQWVRVTLQPARADIAPAVPPGTTLGTTTNNTTDDTPRYTALSLDPAPSAPRERDTTVIEGPLASPSDTGTYSVNGIGVDAAQARVTPAGATLAAGAYAVIEGSLVNGRLRAGTIEVLTPATLAARPIRISGTVAGLDAQATTLVVRDTAIDWSGATFVNGDAGRLAPGAAVQVTGTVSADGTGVAATRIEFR